MKKLYAIIALAFLTIQSERSFSQTSFKFYIHDTIVYCAPKALGDTSCEGNYIRNKTSSPLTINVVRVQNVDILNSGWTSAFCLDACYADFIDSVQFTIAANDSVPFIPHFYYTATPDSQFIRMKIANANNLSDVVYQRFYGVTQTGFGIHEYANLASVHIFPSPLVAGSEFSMNISNVKIPSKEFSLLVYNLEGSLAGTINNLKEGNNTLHLNLAAGMYSYRIVAGNKTITSGKLSLIK